MGNCEFLFVSEICQNNENCTFWTLYYGKHCYLLDRCNLQDDEMAISSEKSCPPGVACNGRLFKTRDLFQF